MFGEGVQLQLVFFLLVGLSAWSLVILAWCASLGEMCATLVGYWFASKIILFVKVKVLGGGLCAYGWVTILLYCLYKNEHISLFSNRSGKNLFASSLFTHLRITPSGFLHLRPSCVKQ